MFEAPLAQVSWKDFVSQGALGECGVELPAGVRGVVPRGDSRSRGTAPPRRTRGRLIAPGYFSQMVTGGAWTVPTVRATAVSPGATKPLGMRALICSTPIMPGALPAYRMSAFSPAMVNEIDSSGCGQGARAAISPTLPLSVNPSPVA